MATRGRRRSEQGHGAWQASRRRALVVLGATLLAGLVVWAVACAVVQGLWPPLLLSPGGFVVAASSLLVAAAIAYRVGRRLASRAVSTTLDDLRAALPGARTTQPRWWTRDPFLDVLLGRDVVLLRAGRRVRVTADVRAGTLLVAPVASTLDHLGDPAVPGTFVDLSDTGPGADGGSGSG
ncbi:MAG: hypothetical protein Q7T56_16810 [Nocardioidaceae bacterium]|nr:hypothetical protein [Nocardioidaceae bacterium]